MKISGRDLVPFVIIFAAILFAGVWTYFIDQEERFRGAASAVLDSIPNDQSSIKALAEKLVEYDHAALERINLEQGESPRLSAAKEDYPELFIVPAEWFSLVAQYKEIPDGQVKRLLEKVGDEPLSTTGAAYWVLEVSQELRLAGAHEEQKGGIHALCGADQSAGLRSGSATKEQKRGVDVLCADSEIAHEKDAARRVAEKAVALMFIDLKLTSMTPETASFEAVVAGKKCDIDLANNVSPEPNRWLVTRLNCKE